MPSFSFTNHIAPVSIDMDGDTFYAMPGIPADDFAPFMDIFAQIPPLVEQLKESEDSKSQMAAYSEFMRLSRHGLEIVMQPKSLERMKERMKDKERPIEATTIASVFAALAGFYMGGKEQEDEENPAPTGDGNDSLPSSDTTGGSSEESSSPAESTSQAGPTTN